ncbi:MAG: fumarate/nitrate reduction transcriptional regulator Fnr [Microcoleus sp.]
MHKSVPNNSLKTTCSTCNLRKLCLPVNLSNIEMARLDDLITRKGVYRHGSILYRSGDKFQALYAIRTGFFKTQILNEDGREQVTGFQMAGEIIGMDGISSDAHTCDAVALEDSEICEIPFNRLEDLGRELPPLQRHLHRILSREIVRDQNIMLLLGSMRAEERLAAFMLNLSQRFAVRGYSPTSFQLRMTRQEIGSYLGLKLETVSRALSHLQENKLINVRNRSLEILCLAGLQACMGKRAR